MEQNVNFDIDRSREMTEYYYFKNGFSHEEIDTINTMAEEVDPTIGTIASNATGKSLEETRKSIIRWLPQTEEWHWVYERLMEMIVEANKELWGFNLYSIPDSIQYTTYPANGGHYDWHMDIGPNELSVRKVSLTIQMSDEEEYVGGDLQFMRGKKEENTPRGKGCVVIFPSYILHRVTPIESGTRKSMVLWVGGEHYK
jgi:PKHD-type hydroxylase